MNFNHIHHLHQQTRYDSDMYPQEPHDSVQWSFTRPCVSANGSTIQDVEVQLENKQMWQQFHAETTEMIITKLGRRMFPTIQIKINGLDRRIRYCVLMEIIPVSKHRHKYIGSDSVGSRYIGWTTAGATEPPSSIDRRIYLHPDSPTTGAHWMQQPVSFTKLKLTNNSIDHHNNVVLTSMYKYIPRIWIIRAPDTINTITNLLTEPSVSFTFAETVFIAVTAYQNENITKLKIDNNPFAKGFRETGHSRCKRKFDGSICDRIRDNEDGGNVSSSDSESHGKYPRIYGGGIMSNSLDDGGVSSSGEMPPSQSIHSTMTMQKIHNHHNNQPRLHRPWTDSPSSSQLAVSNIIARLRPSSETMLRSLVSTTNHSAISFAHFPILFFHSIQHEICDASLRISRYQYHLPLNHHTTKTYPQHAAVFP